MIRVDSIWLATEPMDMRAGTETALARVVAVFGAAKPHCAYLFANRRANRMKVLVHDGVGIWHNWCENQIRPWALGRSNWLFAGSLRSGKRAAAIMSLIQSARLNGHDPYAYLKDILTRLPSQRASEIADLLPHNRVAV
ncbi:hypothetical protein PS691_03148 [Pseudomonas fluorescens]|uniref:Transposase IS66 C-terminal domain-containing protein n=4 Tax=Pseudomonas TaxID=286 RepID=A0A5E7DHL6_PSEFL|nr:hypothetical protein PS691_03148 [Pseudomonas fluorescens]